MKWKSELCDKLNCSEHRTEWNSVERRSRGRNGKRGNISVLSEWGGWGWGWLRREVGRVMGKGEQVGKEIWVCAETFSEMSAQEGTGVWLNVDLVAKINGHEFDCRELWYPGNNDFAGVSLPIQRGRMLHQEDKRGAQSCRFTLASVFPFFSHIAMAATALMLRHFSLSMINAGQNGVLPWFPEWPLQSQHLQVSNH